VGPRACLGVLENREIVCRVRTRTPYHPARILATQNRNHWQALVDTAMNVQLSYTQGRSCRGEWCGRPRRQGPRDGKVNILNERNAIFSQKKLNY
jgi:hypothetical protein